MGGWGEGPAIVVVGANVDVSRNCGYFFIVF